MFCFIFHLKNNRRRLIEVKKRRRKDSILINDKKSSTIQIQITPTDNTSPLSNANIIHRPHCRLYEQKTSLPTSDSIDSSVVNPENPNVNQTNPTTSPTLESLTTSLPVQTLSPILSSKKRSVKMSDITEMICPDVNIIPSAHNIVENLLTETMEKKSTIQFCECHREDNITDDDDEYDDDAEENYYGKKKNKERSKIGLFYDRYLHAYYAKFRQTIINFVSGKYFRRIVLSAIVINTLSMGIEYHGQPQELTNALEYSNLVFTILFLIEMILKLIADGCLGYIRNAYNLFDGCIVLMSVIELHGNKNSGLSVLRTFRLLRVLKLVRFMPTLRRQLVSKRFISCKSNLV